MQEVSSGRIFIPLPTLEYLPPLRARLFYSRLLTSPDVHAVTGDRIPQFNIATAAPGRNQHALFVPRCRRHGGDTRIVAVALVDGVAEYIGAVLDLRPHLP